MTRQDHELDIKANPAMVSKLLSIPRDQILLPKGDKIDYLQPMNAVLVDRLIPSLKRLRTALEVFDIPKTDELQGNLQLLCEILDTYRGAK
ncbi:MAG: hypothetical protein KDK65_02700 [Chlamydiia bacterium]|nr:hypothetical protein [Chlamydiia bacterium]